MSSRSLAQLYSEYAEAADISTVIAEILDYQNHSLGGVAEFQYTEAADTTTAISEILDAHEQALNGTGLCLISRRRRHEHSDIGDT